MRRQGLAVVSSLFIRVYVSAWYEKTYVSKVLAFGQAFGSSKSFTSNELGARTDPCPQLWWLVRLCRVSKMICEKNV